jgi:regulator of replication initiation timing
VNDFVRSVRKLEAENTVVKEENIFLNDRLAAVQKEQQQQSKRKMDAKALGDEDKDLQTKLEKASQYGSVKDMDRLMERYDEMERRFGELKVETGREIGKMRNEMGEMKDEMNR